MRTHWSGGLDGACDDVHLAGEVRRQDSVHEVASVVVQFGVVKWTPIMAGIKERILGLRRRANTAPARVESGTLGTLRLRGRSSIG